MKKYIFKVEHDSRKRGYNRTVTVWQLKNNEPHYVGENPYISTAAYRGDYSEACEIISEKHGHKLTKDMYELVSKNIKLFEL